MKITRAEILMGREIEYPLYPKLEENLAELLIAVNKLRDLFGKPMIVHSGYRPGKYNVAAMGAVNSPHKFCQAVDFLDVDNEIKNWITEDILVACGLWQEDPSHTLTWCHVDTRPRATRVFIP